MGIVIGMIAGVAGAMFVGHLMRGYDQGRVVNGLAGLLGAFLVMAFLALPGTHGLSEAAHAPQALWIGIQTLSCLLGGGAILITVGFLRDMLIK